MPELPEVETMVRGIRPTVVGTVIRGLQACPCPCRPLTIRPSLAVQFRRTSGRRITAVRRVAKRIVLDLDNGSAFVIEPRMTGLMLVADPPDREHLRIEWELTCGAQRRKLWFWDRRGLGTLALLSPRQLHALEFGGRLGPDALGLTAVDWHARLSRCRRPIKVALLDQSLIAGIGNLYASEILHVARLHPEVRTDELRPEEFDRLCAAADLVLNSAIEHEGSTLSDGTYRNVLNQEGGYQNCHRVYDREHERCPSCRRGVIQRIVQAQRSTFFCPACQPRSDTAASRRSALRSTPASDNARQHTRHFRRNHA